MAKKTDYLKLSKPLLSEAVDIEVLNKNFDLIDDEFINVNGRLKKNVEYITESTVWTVPENVYSIDIFTVNGGFDGENSEAAAAYGNDNGAGGAGGAMAYISEFKVIPGQTFDVTVGAENGGTSSFGNIVLYDWQQSSNSLSKEKAIGAAGGSGTKNNKTGNSGNLGVVNNFLYNMPCPIDGMYYGVSGGAGGSFARAKTAEDLSPGLGGIAGRDNDDMRPAGGNGGSSSSTGTSDTYRVGGGGGASYDSAGDSGGEPYRYSSLNVENVGGNGGDAETFGCGGGGAGGGGAMGGKGAQGVVIIGY